MTCESSEPISIPQTNNTQPNDLDLLDEASSLEYSNSYARSGLACDPLRGAMHDSTGKLNLESDSEYSSDGESWIESGKTRPSSPESVFSMCSGRSHGTYRPQGCAARDPWIVAPPPCFTGSRAGELSTIASSPLENLLIEHPSMSVYLSLPPSSLSPSHPFHLATVAGESTERRLDGDQLTRPDLHSEEGTSPPSVTTRRREVQHRHWGIPGGVQITEDQMAQKIHSSQKLQCKTNNKAVSKQKCQRENKVYDKSYCKNSSNRNKRLRPSGCKAGRIAQRV